MCTILFNTFSRVLRASVCLLASLVSSVWITRSLLRKLALCSQSHMATMPNYYRFAANVTSITSYLMQLPLCAFKYRISKRMKWWMECSLLFKDRTNRLLMMIVPYRAAYDFSWTTSSSAIRAPKRIMLLLPVSSKWSRVSINAVLITFKESLNRLLIWQTSVNIVKICEKRQCFFCLFSCCFLWRETSLSSVFFLFHDNDLTGFGIEIDYTRYHCNAF